MALLLLVSCGGDDDDAAEPAAEESPGGEAEKTASSEWPMLGRDLGNTRAADLETEVSADTVGDLAVHWERDGLNGVTATPVVADGTVYFGDWTGHVRALAADTGEPVWETDVDAYYIGGSVAVDDTQLYVATFDKRVIALDRETGDELWSVTVDDHPQGAIFGSPVVTDGQVLIGLASYELMSPNPAPPSFRGALISLDAATGEENWRYWTTAGDETEGAGVSVWSSPAVDEERGHVYIGTGNTYTPPASPHADGVIALDLATGEELWVNQFTEGDTWRIAEQLGTDADVGAPPNLFQVGETDAVGAPDKAGVYRALDRETGEELWSAELTEGGLQGGVLASAAVAEDVVYVASNRASADADLIALDDDSGDELWRIDLEGHVSGPVSWANGVVFVADDTGRISGFDAEDGERLWTHETEAQAAGGIAVVDGTVYAGWGWWFTSPPPDPKGGIIAFRVDGGSGGEGEGDESSSAPDGAEIYAQNCATCHGSEGEGATGPSLEGVDERLTEEEQLTVVREGRGEMPPWEDSLTEEEIEAVVEYQRTVLAGG